MSGVGAIKLAIDRAKEEFEESKLYREWMLENQEFQANRSLWSNIGKILGLVVGTAVGNPAAGFLVGGMGAQGLDALMRPDSPEAVHLGGKFRTQGEEEAVFAMEQAEWDSADDLNMAMSTIMQYFTMGGDPKADFGIGGKVKDTAGVVTEPSSSNTGIFGQIGDMDLATAVGLGTGAFTSAVHSGAGGYGQVESATTTSSEPGTSTADTTPTYDDNTTDETVDEEHRQWLASMGITSPLYNNSGMI